MVNLSLMGYRYLRYILFALLTFGAALQFLYAQNTPATEDELKKQANKLFEEEEFGAALAMYSQLVSNYPKETLYNYRFGVCLLYGSDDKEKPLKYLEFASQKPDAEKEAHFYLGKAYHLNYRFDEAIKEYNLYKTLVSPKQQKKMQVDREIEACNNGKKLLRYITDITVLEKKELSKDNFFYSYDLKGMNGKLIVKPAELVTSIDKKKKDKSVVFSNIGSGVMYFSSYGENGETGRDIYISKRLPNGELGKPQLVAGPINTPYDEDYPYLHPDGKVLYFCSKGHNSMGGYDLFKSIFDETTNTWGKPVNLDFPINTPDDDILYVTDGDEENAYFSSGRGSTDGKIAVYKVRVERRPIDVSMIKGEVKPSRSEQKLNSKITVKDLADGQIVGVYYANENNGSYLLYLPNGGKFLFSVETPGYKAQSEVVQLPVQYELKMMKQTITYDMNEKLVIKNIFDASADDGYELAMDVIKDKAKLEVNKDEPVPNIAEPLASNDSNSTDPNKNPDTEGNQPVKENLNNDQLVQIAKDDAKEAANEAKELKSEGELATSIANEKNELALTRAKEAQAILTNVNNITDPVKKQAEIDKANNLNKEADRLTKETIAAMNFANRLNADAKAKEEEAKISQQYAEELEKASKSKTPGNIEKLEQLQARLDELNKREGGSDVVYNTIKSEADNKQRELIKAKEKSELLQQDIDDRDKQAKDLRSEAENTKNPELKTSILAQAQELEDEKKDIQKELDASNSKVARLQDESDRLRNDMELVSNLITKIKGSDPSIASSDNGNGTGSDILATTRKNDGTNLVNGNSVKNGSNDPAPNTNNGNSSLASNDSSNNGSDGNSSSANNGNSGGTNDGNASGTNDNTSGTNDGNSTEGSAPVDYSMKYEGELVKVEKLSTGSEKETAKAKIYNDWVANINKEIEDTRQAQKGAKTKDEKKLYKMKLDDLEKQKKEKDKLAREALAKAEQAKKTETIVSNDINNGNSGTDPNNTGGNSGNTGDPTASSDGSSVPLAYNQKFDDKINALEQGEGTPYEKENNRSNTYKEWANAINKDIEAKQKEADATTDPEMKALLEKKISDLKVQAQEKEKLAGESARKANELKGQDAVAGTNTNNDPSGTNNGNNALTNGSSNNGNAQANNTGEPSNTIAPGDYSAQRNKELGEADKFTSEYQKEAAKAKIYENWANDIKAEVASLQDELKDTKDKERKKEIKARIKEKEAKAKEKDKIAKETARNADNLKGKEDVLAVNDGSSNGNNAGNSGISNDPTGENGTANNNDPSGNNSSRTNDGAVNNAGGNNGSNNDPTGENGDANNGNPSGNNGSRTNGGSVNNAGGNNGSTNDPSGENGVANNGKPVGNNGSVNNGNTSNGNTNPSTPYTSPSVIAKEQKASTLITEAEKLQEQAEALRSDGSGEEAEKLSEQAKQKRIEAGALLGDANKEQFNSNNDKLEQFAKASANRTEADLSLAELLKDEAKTYFDKAQESRKVADEATDPYAKQSAMNKAYDNELIALNNQKKAETIYLKYNTNPIADNNGSRTNDGSANNVGVNNGSNNNTTGENGVGNNADPSGNNGSRTNGGSVNNTGGNNGANNNLTSEDSVANNGNTPENNGSRTNDGSVNNGGDNGTNNNSTGSNASLTNDGSVSNGGGTNTNNGNSDPLASNNGGNTGGAGNNNGGTNAGNGSTNNTPLSPDDAARVKNSKEYKSYVTLKDEAAQASQEAKREADVAAQFNSEAQRLDAQAKQMRIESGGLTDPDQKKEASRKADDYARQSKINKAKADSVSELARNTEASATAKRMEADLFLQSLDQATYENISTVTGDKKSEIPVAVNTDGSNNRVNEGNNNGGSNNGGGNNAGNTVTPNNEGNPSTNATGTPVNYLSANDRFERTAGPAYSPNKPIPIDEKLPEGVVFKVQIGAFKNPIPQDLFTGMKPITGETTSQGVIRYTAGLFKNSSTAEKAKEDIRALGYKDAFVVAFYNGKRVSMSEAMRILGSDPVAVNDGGNNGGGNTGGGNNSGTTADPNNANGSNRIVTNNLDPAGTAPAEDLKIVKGLLYTVQVGVYARPVSSTQLYNIQPLYNETAPNGYIRYTSGIYNNINKAVEAKNIIVSIGIADAFVTAYYNGKRIPVAEAKQLEASNGSGVFATTNSMNIMPSRGQGGNITQLNNNVQDNAPVNPVVNNNGGTVTPPDNGTNVEPVNDSGSLADKVAASVNDEGVVYKVQIGAFKEEVPIEIANKFIRVANGGIRTYKDENGLTIYTLGIYKSYEQATSLKADLIKEGLTDAFVVAFENGTKVPVERARDLLGK